MSLKDVYEETKVRVAYYMNYTQNIWVKTTWQREIQKEGKSIKSEAEEFLKGIEENVEFGPDEIKINGEKAKGTWKEIWTKLKKSIKRKKEELRIDQYKAKNMQSQFY